MCWSLPKSLSRVCFWWAQGFLSEAFFECSMWIWVFNQSDSQLYVLIRARTILLRRSETLTSMRLCGLCKTRPEWKPVDSRTSCHWKVIEAGVLLEWARCTRGKTTRKHSSALLATATSKPWEYRYLQVAILQNTIPRAAKK